jgi:hypothetical protein
MIALGSAAARASPPWYLVGLSWSTRGDATFAPVIRGSVSAEPDRAGAGGGSGSRAAVKARSRFWERGQSRSHELLRLFLLGIILLGNGPPRAVSRRWRLVDQGKSCDIG